MHKINSMMFPESSSPDFRRSLKTPLLKSRNYRHCATVTKGKQDAFVQRLFNGEKRNAVVYPTLLGAREDRRSREFIIKKCAAATALQLRLKSSMEVAKGGSKSGKFANRLRNQVLGATKASKSRGKLSCLQLRGIESRGIL
jgi:hypothetical protein